MKTSKTIAATAFICCSISGGAHAVSISDPALIPDQRIVTFDDFDGVLGVTGPEQVGAAIGQNVLLSSTATSTVGASLADLLDNGFWGGGDNLNFVATTFQGAVPVGALAFQFAGGPVQAVGAFLNYVRPSGANGAITLLALGTSGTLESQTVSIVTDPFGYNEGAFHGFLRPSADIVGFVVVGGDMVLDNLTLSQPVPEPETYALMLAGLGLTVLAVRRQTRRRKQPAG